MLTLATLDRPEAPGKARESGSRERGPSSPASARAQDERSRGVAQQETTTVAISRILSEAGHEVVEVPVDERLMERLRDARVDIVFNTYAGATGRATQFQVCAMMELLGFRYTGSSAATHALGLAKHITKKILRHDGLPTPGWQTFCEPDEPLDASLRFPLIVKPSSEGSSAGVSEDSVVDAEGELRRALRSTLDCYGTPALAEEFIEGREFTVGVLGNSPPRALPIVEVDFAGSAESGRGFYSHALKSHDAIPTRCPAQIPATLRESLEKLAVAAFRSLECLDYARVDFRVDNRGQPYILELNTLPGMKEGYSDFPRAAAAAGYSYAELVLRVLDMAARRHGLAGVRHAGA